MELAVAARASARDRLVGPKPVMGRLYRYPSKALQISTLACEVAAFYCNNGFLPSKTINRLRPFYDDENTRDEVLSALEASMLKFDCNPFTEQKVENPRVARQLKQYRIPKVPASMIAPYLPTTATAGYQFEEIMAFRCAMEVASHDPENEVTIYRVEPVVCSQVVDSEPFEPGEVIYLSADKAEVLADFDRHRKLPRNVEVVSSKVPVKEIFWSGKGCLTFRWDPRS